MLETRYINAVNGERVAYTVRRGDDGRIIRADIPRERVGNVCNGCPVCAQGGRGTK